MNPEIIEISNASEFMRTNLKIFSMVDRDKLIITQKEILVSTYRQVFSLDILFIIKQYGHSGVELAKVFNE